MVDHEGNKKDDDEASNPSLSPMAMTTPAVTSRIAFGSCHKSERSATPPIWETILPTSHGTTKGESTKSVEKLDAWLWLGDAMYPSHRDPVTRKKYYGPAPPEEVEAGLNSMKHKNATIGYKAFLDRLRAINNNSLPLTGVWDDHDFGGNDMGHRMPSKQERRNIYSRFLGHSPSSEARKPWSANHNTNSINHSDSNKYEGLYHRVDLEDGRIRILVLDTRWFREDHCIPSVAHSIPKGNAVACLTRWLTSGLLLHKYAWLWGKGGCENAKVLGEEQWSWLKNELLVESIPSSSSGGEEPPELFVILSSIQVWSTNPLMEGWGHFPGEQERMWNLLRTHYNRNSNNKNRSSKPNESEGMVLPPAPVLFLSGDVHHAEISGRSGYHEVTSSGLTHHCGQHKLYGPVCEPILQTFTGHRDGNPSESESEGDQSTDSSNGYYIGVNYGVLEILEEEQGGIRGPKKRVVRASIRNSTGHSVLEVVQPLAGHGPVPVLPPYGERAHTMDGHLIPYAQGISLSVVFLLVSVLFLRLR